MAKKPRPPARSTIAERRAAARDKTNLDQLITYKLMRLADTVRLAAAQSYQERYGVTIPELRILAAVAGHQPVSVNEISRMTRIDKGWISRSVVDLVERQLLSRAAHRKDQRVRLLSLTAEGRKRVREMWPFALTRNNQLAGGIDQRDIHRLLDTLQAKAEAMLAEDAGRVARPPTKPARR